MRRWIGEGINQRNFGIIREVYSENYVYHEPCTYAELRGADQTLLYRENFDG